MTSQGFYVLLITAVATVGLGGILLGTGMSSTDWIWRAVIAGTIITFSAVLIHVFTFIIDKGVLLGGFTIPLAMIVSGALGIYFFVTILDFVSGKD